MAHIEYDFSGMKYPIDKIPEAQLFSRLPLLKTIFAETSEMCEDKKWQDYISSEQLMRYIVYVYHRKSPLTEIADIIIPARKLPVNGYSGRAKKLLAIRA